MRTFLAIFASLLLASPLLANTYTATSPAFSDVQSAINSATDGDTVVIPQGIGTWSGTNKLVLTKAITLKGAGGAVGGTNNTIIYDSLSTGQLFNVTLPGPAMHAANSAVCGTPTVCNNLHTRITGIEFRYDSAANNRGSVFQGENGPGPAGIFYFVGRSDQDGSRLIVDNCYFNKIHGSINTETVLGVFSHCTWDRDTGAPSSLYGGKQYYWGGGTDGIWADKSFHDPPGFGTEKFLFVEDCTFNGGTLDIGYSGNRLVYRYNHNIYTSGGNNSIFTTHGTETTGRRRGVRAVEVYNNTSLVSSPGTNELGQLRGGSMLYWGNTYTGWPSDSFYGLHTYRMFGQTSAPWPTSDGLQPWDYNDITGGPSGNGIYYSGTANGASSGTTVTVNGSPGWATNYWSSPNAGYVVRNANITYPGSLDANACEITSNGTNTLTWIAGAAAGGKGICGTTIACQPVAFANGNTVEIRRVVRVMDQPGTGQGAAITQDTVNKVPLYHWTAGQNDQVIEPCYSWGNVIKDVSGNTIGSANFSSQDTSIIEGTHFINNSNITTAYSHYGVSGPYTYPHPLIATASAPTFVQFADGTTAAGIAVNNALSAVLISDGNPTPTFSIPTPGTSGVPSWLSLTGTPANTLSGTPTSTTGSPFTFNVTAANTSGSKIQSVTVTVTSLGTYIIALSSPTVYMLNAVAGSSITATQVIQSTGSNTLHVNSIDNLPGDVKADWTTGDILSTQNKTVTFTFSPNHAFTSASQTITVNCANSPTGTNTFTLTRSAAARPKLKKLP